ncbi:MAG: UDP-N-acetylglucosamine--N-acetylmuramyl-(pentapeptide) pyrophosphoryl-UDP N-acetylglucosamine [Candidatus Taylorbacteria bacterium]|nr:UDP-N-acetylglucosamine--N-acetylmuramyl-(pentapeptide) pyrophosphoryl-UDP N-acetylglucosamine [Candidatus Taylorbacteria bacterium]
MKIVLAGGGSGGHFYPLIAITQSIRDIVKEKNLLQVKIYYLAPAPYNAGVLFDNEIEFRKIHVGKIRRYFSIRNVFDIIISIYGFIEAFFKVFSIYPDVVVSKGGFMSLPVVFAAHILRIPIVIHENDSVPGRANKLASKYATKIALSYAEAGEYFDPKKIAWTGNPLRKEILTPIHEGVFEYMKLEPGIPVITVMGGSLGAKTINETLLNALPELVTKYQIIHQTGKLNFKEVSSTAQVVLEKSIAKERYHPFDYLNELSLRMVAGISDIIITRGGSTIFEIAAWGTPSIIIPITDSNGDHQRKNSYNYARSGGAIVIDENNLTSEILVTEIKDILENPERMKKMKEGALSFAKTDASYKIAQAVMDIGMEHEK